jgi:hypothetical protein
MSTSLDEVLPLAGRIQHPESNRFEWAIVELDTPVNNEGVQTDKLCLRPAIANKAVGDPDEIPVHIALIEGTRDVDGKPAYKVGTLLGQAVCGPERAE